MATVKIHAAHADETPSAKIVATAKKSVDVTDAGGRLITLRKPNPLGNLDFAKAAGGADINQLYLAEVMHLKFVAAIDGDPVATPATEGELRAMYARLGDDGNEAAQLGIFEHFIGDAKTKAATEGELKNS
jgi:hypothetical protein